MLETRLDSPHKPSLEKEGSRVLKSVRLAINLVTNLLLFPVLFITVWFVYESGINTFQLHILFCVIGYHLFMCQGILSTSDHNSWSMFLKRRYRKNIHIVLQTIALILVFIGSALIMCNTGRHFKSIHGILGICALIFSFVSTFNGLIVTKTIFCSRKNIFYFKFFHYLTGLITIFLATGSLCAAFGMHSFKKWLARDDVVLVIILFSWVGTILISIDFWVILSRKIKSYL